MSITETTYPDAYLIGQIQGELKSGDNDSLKLHIIARFIKEHDAEELRRLTRLIAKHQSPTQSITIAPSGTQTEKEKEQLV